MKNLLITGISGFVGSASAEYFLKKGYHIVGLVKDRNLKTRPEILNKCSIVNGDIRDKDCIQYILSKYEIDEVLHLAAQPIVRICNNDPYTAYMTNVVGTLNLLESIRILKKKPNKIICMTSDKSYGAAPVPYKEDTPLVAADSYCTSKLCQDSIARSYALTYDLPVCIVRAGNLYGKGDLNLSRLIPNNVLKLLKGENATLYSGVANYKREFIYIDNIVNAYEVLLEKGVPGEAYNVGDNRPYKILDVITMLKDKINPALSVEILEKDFDEIEEQYLDASKLKALGWTNFVPLSEGLDKTIEWLKNYKIFGNQ
jgi:CDP-glucose 4,6-dehydratase